jgi:hypothetical protein
MLFLSSKLHQLHPTRTKYIYSSRAEESNSSRANSARTARGSPRSRRLDRPAIGPRVNCRLFAKHNFGRVGALLSVFSVIIIVYVDCTIST